MLSWVKGPELRDEATGERDMWPGPEPIEARGDPLRLELGYAMFMPAGEAVAGFKLM